MTRPDDRLLAQLRKHYLFADLSDAQMAELRPHLDVRAFDAGERLFDQGDEAASFFLLHRGTIKLFRVSAGGQEKIMRLIQAGQSFAESVMFMGEPRYPVNAQGLKGGQLVSISASAYLRVMQASFASCRTVMARMTERIQSHWDEIEALTLQNTQYRIVHYLLGLVPTKEAASADLSLPTRKGVIASHLGVTPETFSRVLRLLQEDDVIRMQGAQVHIPNVAALRRYSA